MKKLSARTKTVQKVRYFAYGSNMVRERLERRVGRVEKVGTAVLNGYELTMDCGIQFCSYANVVRNLNSTVEGVIYLLTPRQVRELSRFEAFYRPQYIRIDGQQTLVYISYIREDTSIVSPTVSYVRLMLQGFRENNQTRAATNFRQQISNIFGITVEI